MEKGKKLALLVGCNYPNVPDAVLQGCYNDVLGMRETLITRFLFDPKHVELLIDKPGSSIMPTGANIKWALNKMIDEAKEGDTLFFHFSGHGTLIEPPDAPKEEEAIIACDMNVVTSVDFRQIVNRVPKGATFIILSDSCHSGGLIDKEKEQIGPAAGDAVTISKNKNPIRMIPFQTLVDYFKTLTGKTSTDMVDIGTLMVEVFGDDASLMFRNNNIANSIMIEPLKPDQGILLSGCLKNELSEELRDDVPKPCGAFTYAVQIALKENPGRELTNREIVMKARKIIHEMHHENPQHPGLYCSDQNADAVFLGPPVVPRQA